MIYLDLHVHQMDESTFYNINKILKINLKYNRQGILSAAAWMLLKYGLENEFGVCLSDLEIQTGTHGKPYFAGDEGLEFNLSHSHHGIAAALSRRPVGTDLQKILPYNERLADRICSEREKKLLKSAENPAKTLYSIWAMKESYVKFTGEGMTGNFAGIPYEGKAKLYDISPEFALAVCCEENLDVKKAEGYQYLWM